MLKKKKALVSTNTKIYRTIYLKHREICVLILCAGHGIHLVGENPTTGIYRQV